LSGIKVLVSFEANISVKPKLFSVGIMTLVIFSSTSTVVRALGDEYALILARYGKIHTIAGRGAIDSNGGNDWLEAYEGGLARDAELSEAHNAQADVFGNIYIVDKDSHAVRKVATNGTIHRVAGINTTGDGGDDPQPGAECALSIPNGLDVHPDGTCYIFDTGNHKIRRLDPNGTISTVFTDPALSLVGRGLWASVDGSVIYYANGTDVREWTASSGIRVLADGFSGGLANLTVDPQGRVVVTDRTAHSVYRLETDGTKTRIAGNGLATGGGDGQPALETALEEVRGVAFVPSGGFFACTHRGSDVWFIDTNGIAHLFISGVRNSNPFNGEGMIASSAGDKLSEVRAINLTPGGDLIITQSDESTIRIVENLIPPTIEPLRLDVEQGVLQIRWSSAWDGGALEGTGNLSTPEWLPVLAVAAIGGSQRWSDSTWLSRSQSFFRFVPAVRWPAP
jgi:sugar lactone lactonase YvrE